MARSHHRKKHKTHLRQFKQSQEVTTGANSRGKSVMVLTVGGALAGLAVSYFASGGIIWLIIGALVGGTVGYVIGRKMDSDLNR
jgi:ABC-type dipeptide/oligopeptide/nickel transport system permease subunit